MFINIQDKVPVVAFHSRVCADKDIGEVTCITPRGRSVVDYFLLSFSDFDYISEFIVCDPDEYSDKCALYICLNLISNENSCSSSGETNFVRKLIWSCKNEELFKNSLFQQFCKYEDLISIVETDNSSVSEVVDKFSTLLFNNAYLYFGKTCQDERQHQSQNHKPNLWFDNSCTTAKQS